MARQMCYESRNRRSTTRCMVHVLRTAQRILDIGTGTGLVALMLAQRSNAFIVALEIDCAAAKQATENVVRSPWQDRIEVLQVDFKQYTSTTRFDVIVSNPPYFVDSLKCPDQQRNAAGTIMS